MITDTHEARQARLRLLTKQLSCLFEPVYALSLLFDLNWILGFFSGDKGTITEERGCTNIWMTPSEDTLLLHKRSQRGEQEMDWTVSSMTLHCIVTM